ncbi:MAG TPA: type I restriction endonuclease [Panacibacter sp.]|nr:type I restriction endonuclease [Panacibacter sp.]
MLEEVSFTDGRIYVKGKLPARGERKRPDYILYYKSIPVAIIEAKDNIHSIRSGIQQALGYAKTLDIPCAFSSNGDGFLFHDILSLKRLLNGFVHRQGRFRLITQCP